MTIFICTACGTSYPQATRPPERCRICEDERQFVPPPGQGWIAREALARQQRNAWQAHEAGLLSVQSVPGFAINQRAFLLRTPAGNVLWDCIALLDEATRLLVEALGGLHAIAISHPHYYTTMQDWAAAFGAPIHLHAADAEWIVRPDEAIRLWAGETLEIAPGATLIRAGGHFAGGTVLHCGEGVLLSGDILQVTPGGDRVSFLWSYPNMLPLSAATVRAIAARLQPFRYQRIYGAFAGREVLADGEAVVARSVQRYVELVSGAR
jgi:glyoxylase-like metal-dependent hydrolase (beta-lactamase superfamily II)